MIASIWLARVAIAWVDVTRLRTTCSSKSKLEWSVWLLAGKYIDILRAQVVISNVDHSASIETTTSSNMVSS